VRCMSLLAAQTGRLTRKLQVCRALTGVHAVELWCKGGKGQFSVAGNTVIFVPGAMEERNCPEARAQGDDELLAALGAVETWKRQGDYVMLAGPKALRFHLNTN
jgi:hypothetical protein